MSLKTCGDTLLPKTLKMELPGKIMASRGLEAGIEIAFISPGAGPPRLLAQFVAKRHACELVQSLCSDARPLGLVQILQACMYPAAVSQLRLQTAAAAACCGAPVV